LQSFSLITQTSLSSRWSTDTLWSLSDTHLSASGLTISDAISGWLFWIRLSFSLSVKSLFWELTEFAYTS
jgi:hypothetical protein